jgi:hypothetical protein
MAITMNMMWEGVTPDQYDEVRKRVGWESNPAAGGLFHVASFGPAYTPGVDGALYVTDIWESAAQFEEFAGTRLMPVVKELGITSEPTIVMLDTHTTWLPDAGKVDALQRPLVGAAG